MILWAISDLHLSFARPKPMDIFGDHWRGHVAKVERAWRECVAPGDIVCLPGDLSWAMRLSQVADELRWLQELPGRKVLLKGNHDYWWESAAKVRKAFPEGLYALHNDALLLDGVAFGGARGWVDPSLDFRRLEPSAPEEAEANDGSLLRTIRGPEEDERIYRRELDRLEASLQALDRSAVARVALLHFPPTSPAMEETPVTRILEKHRVDAAVFGHLHGAGWQTFKNPYGIRNGVRYDLVSADFAHFSPVKVAEIQGG